MSKADGVFIQANADVYLSMSARAQAFAEAGLALMQSVSPDGAYSIDAYNDGVMRLAQAVDLLNS